MKKIEDEEINSFYSKQTEDNKRYNGKSASEEKNYPDRRKYSERKPGQQKRKPETNKKSEKSQKDFKEIRNKT